MAEFNLKNDYDEQIKPLMQEIKEICLIKKIPFYATFMIASDGQNDFFEQEILTPEVLEIEPCDHRIADYVRVNKGLIKEPDIIVFN